MDDWADNERGVRKNKELIKLFTKGRRWVRKNATQLFIFRLRNQKDFDTILE